MQRRMILAGAAASAAGLVSGTGTAAAADSTTGGPAPDPASQQDLAAALERFRASIPAYFDRTYVENAVVPFFLTSVYEGERPALPMIDTTLSKENALPHDLWGLIFQDWKPTPESGVTVFLTGLENRGDNNLRKRIYMSAVTPDLYAPVYGPKVVAFFDGLMDPKFAGAPMMRHYLDYYWDIYWDLHLGVKGDAIPPQIRTIGESFNTVLAYRDPTQPIVYENYMTVRSLLPFLISWIDDRLDDITNARIAEPQKTMAWYWLKNAQDGSHFAKKDVVFECFHNFVAFSQWGNSMFGIMSRLSQDGGDPDIRAAFEKTMSGNPDAANGGPFTPLDLFVMELFRVISPNGGSISTISDTRTGSSDNYGDSLSPFVRFGLPYERSAYIISPHTSTSFDTRHWTNPEQFDPDRYRTVPTSDQVDEARSKQIGFPKCPFDLTAMKIDDGRNATMANSAFGTVFGVVDGKPLPVCDYAGFAPFGFGYRRCPGEQLTTQVFEDFLRKVWREKIAFRSLNLPSPRRVPIGPGAVIDDNITFTRPA
jgi:hypothetical protein